jgi:hypothetical protein
MDLANSIVLLQPGLYILRHPKTGLPPISISRAAGKPEHNGQIQALYTPGTDGGVLRGGADAIVMQVLSAPVELLVTAYLEKAGAAVPVIKIDKVGLDGSNDVAAQAKAMEVPAKGISLVGHIERKGDVVAAHGNTLGDPKSELRVEGFQIEWPDKPEGLDLAYSARIDGMGATPTVSSGKFCGTRNAAKRIVEVTFALSGPKAAQFTLKGTAHFSGGFSKDVQPGVALHGPTGMEHLTALELDAVPTGSAKAAKGAWEASPRTKIFKPTGNHSGSRAKK